MEIEEAIKICEDFIEENKDRKIILHTAIRTVLQALKNVIEERDIYKEEHDRITKVLNLKEGSLNPPVEIVIESIKKALQNSIPKKKIEDKVLELKEDIVLENDSMYGKGNREYIKQLEFAIEKIEELLEDK